jgi:hypothetical protein
VAGLKEGGGASGAHQRGEIVTAASPDSSLPAVDCTNELDNDISVSQRRWRRGTPWAAAMWSWGSKSGGRSGFPAEAEGKGRGERGRLGRVSGRKEEEGEGVG